MQISEYEYLLHRPEFFATILIAYILGSIPFAVIIGQFTGLDIRSLGSGNPGATNMMRHGGKKLGALTFLLDALKGMAAVAIGKYFGFPLAAAFWVVIGHCFSIYLQFKGGKGVATTLGALLILCPLAGFLFAGFWLLTYLIFRISSVAALLAIWLTCLSGYFFCHNVFLLILFFALLITLRHRSNIAKLIEGSEH